MKIGDQVRFLSETGGGKVAGFQGKNIVLVEDEDGFRIPTAINEVVVVNTDDYSTSRIVENKLGKSQPGDAPALGNDQRSVKAMLCDGADEMAQEVDEDDPSGREIAFLRPAQERKGGNALSAYLAFVPVDVKAIWSTIAIIISITLIWRPRVIAGRFVRMANSNPIPSSLSRSLAVMCSMNWARCLCR